MAPRPLIPKGARNHPGAARGESLGAAVVLHDLGIRLVGVPLLGLVIPQLTGLFATIGPRSRDYWIGCAWFVLLSALVWQGNRRILVFHRRRYDWSDHPWRKVLLVLFANSFYTVPVTLAMLLLWYRFLATPTDWVVVKLTAVVVVGAALLVAHVYETVYLIQQRESDLVVVARLDRARAEAELVALKSQIDPHFLFNSLSSLAYLIPQDPVRAIEFTQRVSDVYQYILLNRERDLVPLAEELAFAFSYVRLLGLRFGTAVRLCRDGPLDAPGLLVVPVSLQVLLENAVKHNAVDAEHPLEIRVARHDDQIEVSNALRRVGAARRSSRVGLANLDERCRLATGRPIEVHEDESRFAVALPLVRISG
jgi:two-component system, LytTR family, sensor kinase